MTVAALVVGEFVVVVAVVAKALDEKLIFLAEGKPVAWSLFAVPPHIAAERAVGAGVAGAVRNLDIAVLVEGYLADAPAYAVLADRVGAY